MLSKEVPRDPCQYSNMKTICYVAFISRSESPSQGHFSLGKGYIVNYQTKKKEKRQGGKRKWEREGTKEGNEG